MKKTNRKLLLLAVAFAFMIFTVMAMTLTASAERRTNDSGTCGYNTKYLFDAKTGELIIYGTGSIQRWPWLDYASSIKTVIIDEGVTSIEGVGFSDCANLKQVTLPSTLTYIGNGVFYGCYALESIHIPESVTVIGESAFAGCYSLKSLTIPQGVKAIEAWAFNSSIKLESVTIPQSVTSIGECAFAYCLSLTEITVDEENPYYTSVDGNLYDKNMTFLIQYAIGKTDASFSIPDSVNRIGIYSFGVSDYIQEIVIPARVKVIEDWAFYKCEKLINLSVDAENPYFTSIDGNLYSKDQTSLLQYAVGKEDTSFVIPDHVNYIGIRAFSGAMNLNAVTIPNSVKIIGENAFSSCKNLTSLTLPNSITRIDSGAFALCESLTSIVIPDKVRIIDTWTFGQCANLEHITLPNGIKTICERAFEACYNLQTITYCGTEEEWNVIFKEEMWDERTGNFKVKYHPTHTWGEWEKHDGEQHKQACACGDVIYETHAWNDGEITIAPTTESEGVKTFTCTVCGETKNETVQKLPATTVGGTSASTNSGSSSNSGCGSTVFGGIALILPISLAAVALIKKKED